MAESKWTGVSRFFHSTLTQVVGTLIVITISGGVAYRWLAGWIAGSMTVRNWLVSLGVLAIVGAVGAAVVLALKLRHLQRRDLFLRPPWEIRDSGIGLVWYLRQRPETWIADDLDGLPGEYIDTLIDGPLHDAGLKARQRCHEHLVFRTKIGEGPLVGFGDPSVFGRFVASTCPRCGTVLYADGKAAIQLDRVKRVTLKNLRRHHHLGRHIRDGFKADDLGQPLLAENTVDR